MKFVSSLALAAVLLAGGVAAAPAAAQNAKAAKGKNAAAAPQERKYDLSKEARQPIADLSAAVTAKNYANFPALLAAAEAVAKKPDEKYLVAKFRLQHAIDTNDKAAQRTGVEAVLASGGADAAETASMRAFLASQAVNSGDFAAGESFYGERVAANANDLDAVVNLARVKLELKKDAEALPLLQRAIALTTASGKKADEAWYRKAMEIAHAQKNRPLALQLSRDVLGLYPSEINLRNAVIVFREATALDKEADLDLLRLMRVSRVMSGAGAYLELAQILNDAGLPGEAKSVLDDGTRLGHIKGGSGAALLAAVNGRVGEDRASLAAADARARSGGNGTFAMKTATAYLGYGDYAKAADLYRVALAKGGVDANLVNTRLGMALALAGQKAEATAALKAVTGVRSGLAALWLAWMNQRA
jgi:tetratricopeptide (TPR) repeat protein